ncbi:uncharacterized protein [Arachis hypogaea]|uniref:uncharacterized protein isoform X2 n=1 Tax=Arachis hypogaea TaxID=3818 RepID=UPI000DEC1B53|nr:uncharacterized protein LOC112716522 isoform X2 [Arachis hypogaea]QHO17308.1 putative protein phosphatase 2C [Arachis hypogaea]
MLMSDSQSRIWITTLKELVVQSSLMGILMQQLAIYLEKLMLTPWPWKGTVLLMKVGWRIYFGQMAFVGRIISALEMCLHLIQPIGKISTEDRWLSSRVVTITVKHAYLDCFCSGSTAVTIVKQGSILFMSNIGDSRAIMGSKDSNDSMVAIQLTIDLKPDLPREAERIKRCKGRVFALKMNQKFEGCGYFLMIHLGWSYLCLISILVFCACLGCVKQ